MINAIKNTLLRLSAKIYIFNPWKWYPLLLEGITTEFERVREFKDKVLSATVANENMTPDAIDDYNRKYGIPNTLPGTDSEKIMRIIEKASLNGYPGPDWFEEQIQKAGFQLYVHENLPQTTSLLQWNDFQWGPDPSIQWGLTQRFTDPATIPGTLVVGSPPFGAGRLFLTQWGSFQWGDYQWRTPDPNALNPQPYVYTRTTDPQYWGFYFTLSPFPDRLAVDSSEFAVYTNNEFEYLKNLIIELKVKGLWCILQARASGV